MKSNEFVQTTSDAATPVIRIARRDDVAEIVALFADDAIGSHGDTSDPSALPDYLAAFERIEQMPGSLLHVVEVDGNVIGTFETILLLTLTGRGSSSLLLKAVHVAAAMRGRGIGARIIAHCEALARDLGTAKIELVTNADRGDAHRFYERHGFVATHKGYRLAIK